MNAFDKLDETEHNSQQSQQMQELDRPSLRPGQFDAADGRRYQIIPPKVELKGKVYDADEAADNESVREALVQLAWESNEAHTPREEDEFDVNNILKIVY